MSTSIRQNRIDRINYFKHSITVIRGRKEATLLLDGTLWGTPHPLCECSHNLWLLRNHIVKRRRDSACERTLDRIVWKLEKSFLDGELENYESEYDEAEDRILITLEISCAYPRNWK